MTVHENGRFQFATYSDALSSSARIELTNAGGKTDQKMFIGESAPNRTRSAELGWAVSATYRDYAQNPSEVRI